MRPKKKKNLKRITLVRNEKMQETNQKEQSKNEEYFESLSNETRKRPNRTKNMTSSDRKNRKMLERGDTAARSMTTCRRDDLGLSDVQRPIRFPRGNDSAKVQCRGQCHEQETAIYACASAIDAPEK